MTQIFQEDGSSVPVSCIELLPLTVVQVKTEETDGYNAIQVGYVSAKPKHLTKAQIKHFESKKLPLFRKLKEIRVTADAIKSYEVGAQIDPSFLTNEF
jgi:large subunit ribosomal protein L3